MDPLATQQQFQSNEQPSQTNTWTDSLFIQRFTDFFTTYRDPELGFIYQKPPYNISLEAIQNTDYELYSAIITHPHRAFKAANSISNSTFHFTTPKSALTPQSLTSANLNQLISLRGIALSASQVSPKLLSATGVCRACGDVFSTPETTFPSTCQSGKNCGQTPYSLVPQLCKYRDFQTLKLTEINNLKKENAVTCTFENNTCNDQLSAGNHLILTGIPTPTGTGFTFNAFGCSLLSSPPSTLLSILPSALLSTFKSITSPHLSIAPHLQGLENVKLAIACMLASGNTRYTTDNSRMRGQIHILLLSDPGVGKSEILKTASELSEISVLTSGRGSSTAGLTAAAVRGMDGEWQLEGGALVVADGGILCLDEFDKTRSEDVVALHEAMEQGTISVNKAGVSTVLSTSVSILAAANPVFGRYDELKGLEEQIDLPESIASRFDLIFLLKDVADTVLDGQIAMQIYDKNQQKVSSGVDFATLKSFFAFVRELKPEMTAEAERFLTDFYVQLRRKTSVLPVGIRQLEGLIRISEAMAKLEMRQQVTLADAERAVKLFQAAQSDLVESALGQEISKSTAGAVNAAMAILRAKMPLKMLINEGNLIKEGAMLGGQEGALAYAVSVMVQNGEVERVRGKQVMRVK